MKRHARNKKQLWGTLASAGVVAGAAVITGIGSLTGTESAEALTYQSSVGVNFTVKPSLSVSLSNPMIYINDLAPGTSADSNVVTISVVSNASNGYTLSSTVGNATYDNRNLTNKDDSTATFTSVDFGAAIDYAAGGANLNDTKWAYTSSTDGGTSWNKYSGLPLYSDTEKTATLLTGSAPTTGDAVQFKIAAKAAQGQVSGEYKNVINFVAVAEPDPYAYMQDVDTWGSELKVGDAAQAIDERDGKTYYIARLADGNIWMTQNLDFDIVAGKTYTSADTDIKADWTPSVGTTTGTSWTSSYTAPQSYDPGDLCWNGTISTTSGTLANRTVACSNEGVDKHTSVGNYYNWTAAVAMDNSSSYTSSGTDVDQSICPAGWRLPTYSGNYSFYKLIRESGYTISSGTSGNIQSDPLYFVYGGGWSGSSGNVGYSGYYWSSVVYSSNNARDLYFVANGSLSPQDSGYRSYGRSVRCVAR